MKKIGTLISGSLTDGFVMKVDSKTNLEELKTGKFVSVKGKSYKFFSMITDLKLEVSNQDILLFPPDPKEKFLSEFIQKKDLYITAYLRPMLMLDVNGERLPVKTVPTHFSEVYDATKEDVAMIFGSEEKNNKQFFSVGSPLDMQTPVCLDLGKLTERSNGIFGKTGTGKTFLTRLVLAGLVKSEQAINLIFDMHSEYGLQARKEGPGESFVKGLKTLFPDKVVIFSLDPESTRRRGGNPDVEIVLSYQSVSVEDILSLQEELNLHATALEAAYLIAAKFKKDWLQVLLSQGENLKEFAQDLGAHPESIAALYRKLKRIERLSFFRPIAQGVAYKDVSVIDQMMEYIDKGKHIIVEFGNYTSTFCYLLVANIISRRIHDFYIQKTEKFLGSQKKEDEPKKLMITIEEAHKFLNPSAARQTIFGNIAREMRKYYVSLLVVDQRPSGIDQEIISQIGTKIIAQLNDDRDINSVLTGVNGATTLRSVLASLDSKKQALILGHAVAMPVVIQTREYDSKFYEDMSFNLTSKQIDGLIEEIF
ncbi:MAG: HerA helicase [candidate division TM6 bacterium GW2011_GWF2_32_72]|nr:MAG: HerA helicase [candidate division TM6 bacterium GW2011_GWF2_32_72]